MKIALLQCNSVTGDVAGNQERILEAARRAAREGADLCVTPELALCGVAPGHYLRAVDFAEGCRTALRNLAEALKDGPPLLVGAQGTRKSTFCRSIMPPSECSYYTDSLDFSRKKDVELSLNRFALINIDEFDQVSATQQGFLKHILQKPVVNARRPYGTSVVEMRRYASFIATSNHKDLLTDPSGSRRFICIEVKGVIDTSRPIDYDQLYAQAMHELAHGERYWFNDADEYVMTEANREFQQYSPEEQFLFRYFRMAEAGEEGEWMAPAEILKILHQEVDIPLNAKRVAAFGRILRKQGIPSRHTRKGTVYQLVRA